MLRSVSDWLGSKPTEFRKVVHLCGLIFLIPIVTWPVRITVILLLLIVVGLWLTLRFAALGLIGACAVLLLAGQRVAGAAWVCLIIGDGFAGLCGLRWGAKTLPWNAEKTVLGSSVFVLATWPCLAAYFTYASGFRAVVAIPSALMVAALVAIAEGLPYKSNDNLIVVTWAGFLCWLATMLRPTVGA